MTSTKTPPPGPVFEGKRRPTVEDPETRIRQIQEEQFLQVEQFKAGQHTASEIVKIFDTPPPFGPSADGGGRKDDQGKPRMDLIPPEALFGYAKVLTFGAAKYADRNWERGMAWGRVFGAAMRHLWAWWRGEEIDAESGLPHLYHAIWCVGALLTYRERRVGTDDRWKGGAE